MKPVYIHSGETISVQNTFEAEQVLEIVKNSDSNKWKAYHPNYKAFISPVASRRMSSSIKMGVACAKKALAEAQSESPDAVIIGTGKGCIESSEDFLNALIDNDEQYLTPTSFILSTHNTVAAQIALILKCKGYNNTLTNLSASFESALIDAQLLISENENTNVLVGGVEELGNEFIELVELMDNKEAEPIKVPYGEGASIFMLSDKKSSEAISLTDVETYSKIGIENIQLQLEKFLEQNNLHPKDIDVLILGNNGDSYDTYYNQVSDLFKMETPKLTYKQFFGEFLSASAIGFWLGFEILKKQEIPKVLSQSDARVNSIKNVLIYNQFKGRDHSFALLSK